MSKAKDSRFKGALCLRTIPEAELSSGWIGLSHRYRVCQRLHGHPGQHRSWGREWDEGDRESRARP